MALYYFAFGKVFVSLFIAYPSNILLKTVMKKIIPLLILIFSVESLLAQRIYVEDTAYKADLSIYEVDREYKADLLVFKVDREYKAKGDTGLWYFTDAVYKADKSIFFVDREYKADLKVFFVDREYKAGWKN